MPSLKSRNKHVAKISCNKVIKCNSIPWSEVNPETLGVWQIWGDSSLNLAASSVLVSSSTGHSVSLENPEAE